MKTPSLFAHYWSENENLIPFQEVMNWDINPSIMEIIQTELTHQLNSEYIQHILPNFNWESNRLAEKWNSAMQSLLVNICLPEKIWLDWIQDLTNKTIHSTDEPKQLEEIYPSFDELLNAEVYYSSPADSLEEMPDDTEIEVDTEIEDDPIVNEEIIIEGEVDIEFSVLNLEIGTKTPSEKKILDILSDSPEEKVFEKLQSNQDNSLKDRIHTEMTSSLAETLPLFQKINFIQNLFDGESSYLDQIIEFIDHEANKSTDWKSILQTKYMAFQRADNHDLWNELYEIIERKFS